MQRPNKASKVLIAAGGTGGHLIPAQGLAEELLEQDKELELIFAGAKLSTNSYLDREKFLWRDISSATPFQKGLIPLFKSLKALIWGIFQSYRLLSRERPDFIVGFGSFHVFPILCAAVLKRIPLYLFESNAIPGKVVRLFSKRAVWTGVYFSEVGKQLKGKTKAVEIPGKKCTAFCNLQGKKAFTILVFGGSQGAQKINSMLFESLASLKKAIPHLQLIHLTGSESSAREMRALCDSLEISAHVAPFEKNMESLWREADLVICRAGAMTIAEFLSYEIPPILIPYPKASDEHQLRNALFIQRKIPEVALIEENQLTSELLLQTIFSFAHPESKKILEVKNAIKQFNAEQKRENFCKLLQEIDD